MKLKITKFIHSCLLVETPDRVAIFDPGSMSAEALGQAIPSLERLDDIFITHVHPDHCDPDLIKRLADKFPDVRITTTAQAAEELAKHDIKAATEPPEGAVFFDSPHESAGALFGQTPQEIGVHYLDTLSDPGDSHSFKETKAILALPVSAPWGSTIRSIDLALELQPRHVLPIHDWHWSEEARRLMYGRLESVLGQRGITFHKLETGQPVEIEV